MLKMIYYICVSNTLTNNSATRLDIIVSQIYQFEYVNFIVSAIIHMESKRI